MTNFKSIRCISNGNFSQISNDLLMDNRLEDGSKVLFQLLINNSNNWTIRLDYYTSKPGWNPKKMTRIINNLIECGYMKKNKKKNNKGQYDYFYVLDESGKQNTKPAPSTQPIQQPESTLDMMINNCFKDYIPPSTYQQKVEIIDLMSQINDEALSLAMYDLIRLNKEAETIIATIKSNLLVPAAENNIDEFL